MTFLALTNAAYADFAKNLIANFQEPFLQEHRLILHCIGRDAYERLRHNPPSNVSILWSSTTTGDAFQQYGTPGFNSFTRHKFRIILEQLKQCAQIWYVDCDVAFFADPAPFARADMDIVFQTDAPDEALMYDFGCVCTGCMLLTNNQRTRDLLQEAMVFHRARPELNDQSGLQAWGRARSWRDLRRAGEYKFDVFDPRRFMNGYFAFDRRLFHEPGRVMIHANFVIGDEQKRERLETCGGWFVPEDPARAIRSRVAKFLAERGIRARLT